MKSLLKQYFFAGLAILIPLGVTLWVGKIFFAFLTKPFGHIAQAVASSLPFDIENSPLNSFTIPLIAKTLSITLLFALLLLLGYIGQSVIVHWFIGLGESLLMKLPFINKVYKACKELTGVFFSESSKSVSKVALIPFPSEEEKSIGFITNSLEMDVFTGKNERYVTVLIPGAPNPTVGFLLFIPEKDVQLLDTTAEEAMKYIISCGSGPLAG